MNISEFENFCVSVPLVNDLFGQWDASYCIGMAMMTQINDIDYDKHLQCQFIEFLEAFCRACQMASFAPPDQEGQMDVETRKNQPFHVKIENVMPYVMRNCAKRNFIEK